MNKASVLLVLSVFIGAALSQGDFQGSYQLTEVVPITIVATESPPPGVLGLDYLTLYPVYHDFRFSSVGPPFDNGSNPDFQDLEGADTGIVSATLGSDGLPEYAPGPSGSSATTHGQNSFYQWFRQGWIIKGHALYLLANGDGSFTYNNQKYFPIDNEGWGNQGSDGTSIRNFAFCSLLSSHFTYTGTEYFSVVGDDDVYLYLNGILAINLGGVHGPESGSFTVSDLDPAPSIGSVVDFLYLQCERHTTGSDVAITTNFQLQPVPPAGVSQDPHFTGLHGEKYDVVGQPNKWFNLVSDRAVQVNALFLSTCDNKTHATIMDQFGILINNNTVELSLDGVPLLNGKPVACCNGWKRTPIGPNGTFGSIAHPWENYVVIETEEFTITFIRHLVNFAIQKPGWVFYGKSCNAGYFNLKLVMKDRTMSPHGLLGQTAHHVHKVPVWDSKSEGEGEIEGTFKDYIVSSKFGTDFKFNKYNL